MKTPIGGTTHLSEYGEALQESSRSEKNLEESMRLSPPIARWYALHTYSRHEKRVHEDLILRCIHKDTNYPIESGDLGYAVRGIF
jgi:hypothetical protein